MLTGLDSPLVFWRLELASLVGGKRGGGERPIGGSGIATTVEAKQVENRVSNS